MLITMQNTTLLRSKCTFSNQNIFFTNDPLSIFCCPPDKWVWRSQNYKVSDLLINSGKPDLSMPPLLPLFWWLVAVWSGTDPHAHYTSQKVEERSSTKILPLPKKKQKKNNKKPALPKKKEKKETSFLGTTSELSANPYSPHFSFPWTTPAASLIRQDLTTQHYWYNLAFFPQFSQRLGAFFSPRLLSKWWPPSPISCLNADGKKWWSEDVIQG